MTDLSEKDIERISASFSRKMIADRQERVKLTGEEVYDLKRLATMFRQTRGIFWKSFLGLAIIGTIALAAMGLGYHK